jgi:hypothetical protein
MILEIRIQLAVVVGPALLAIALVRLEERERRNVGSVGSVGIVSKLGNVN